MYFCGIKAVIEEKEIKHMKFKGIELKEGRDSEAELLVNVELVGDFDEDELEERMEELEDELDDIVDYDNICVYVEAVDDKLLQVRCDDITFDEKGVNIINVLHNDIVAAGLSDIKISIGVHVDGEEWFKREDGSEYNEDMVTLDEFLANVEY